MKKNKPFGELFYRSLKKILLIMRIAIILLILGILQARATDAYSQKTRLSLNFYDTELIKVLDNIEDESDFFFLYNEKLLNTDRKVNISTNEELISSILDNLFVDTDVKYTIIDRKIILAPEYLTKETDKATLLQQKVVSGTITDAATGEPMPGVNIVIKGTNIGVLTDVNGKFSIAPSDPDNAILVFSFIGYGTKEIPIAGKSIIDAALNAEIKGLEEVIVIGYGSVKKSDLTGSVSSINISDLQSTPIASVEQGLVGRAAGVMVTQSSGMPGAIASIRIRGTNSLQGGNEPLYVIDGFPIYNGTGYGNTGGYTQYSGLSTINSSDIESIEILKDASATSIYGARAANGVVLITTKSGKRGTDVITFESTYGIQRVAKEIDVMNALEFAELINEAYTNDGLTPFYNASEMQAIRQNPEGTNWQDQIFRTAPTQNYQLNFSGGDQKMIYSITANYFDQEGIICNSDFKRYSGRVNLERNILSNFRVGSHINVSKTIANAVVTNSGGTNSGVVSTAMKFNPVLSVFENYDLKIYTPINNTGIPYPNPVATAKKMIRENQVVRMLGDIFGEWEIIPDLKAKVSFGADLFNSKFNTFIPSSIQESAGVAVASISSGFTTNWLNENTLSWNKIINSNHKISLLGGITFQQNHYEDLSASSQSYVNDVLEENSLEAGAIYNKPSSSNSDWGLISYLARADYNMKERYLFSLSSRIDGSSRFGSNNKYALFPSGSFAWRLIEEDFIKNLELFTNLKLRASYGFTGNQEIGSFNSLPTLGSTNYTIGRQLVTGFYPNIIPNPDLKWEKTSQLDFGLDFGFWENRLRVTADYYHKKTTDLLYAIAIPYVSGFSTSLSNIGSMQNQGFELAIESDNFTGDFQWTTNFNISFNKNKVLELGGEEYKDIGGGDGHLQIPSAIRLIVGEPIGLFYGYVFDGIFQNQTELDAGPTSSTNWIGARRYMDLGGPDGIKDGVVDATYDRTVIGNPNPDFTGGITNTFFYKGFELNVFMQYSYGNDILNFDAIELTLPSGGQNVYADLVNRWTPTNPSNKYPKATTNRNAIFCDDYIEDGSFLKVKTLTFAYTFPTLKVKHVSDFKLYITGQNLITFTKYSGFDPEVNYRGATSLELGQDFGGYPQAKTILLGVKLNIK